MNSEAEMGILKQSPFIFILKGEKMNKQVPIKVRMRSNKLVREIGKRSPIILVGMGIASGIVTVGLTVKATVKATELIKKEMEERDVDDVRDIPPRDIVDILWKPYLPVLVTGIFSISCIVGSYSIHAKRNAALAAAYKLSETAFTSFKDKAAEEVGEKKVKEIHQKVAEEQVTAMVPMKGDIYNTGYGTTLCFDTLSSRYFYSDRERIRKAVNDINWYMNLEMFVSLNEYYEQLGLPTTKLGNDLGWNIDKGMVDPVFSSMLTEGGEPCLVVDFRIEPRYDYTRLY